MGVFFEHIKARILTRVSDGGNFKIRKRMQSDARKRVFLVFNFLKIIIFLHKELGILC